MFFKYNPNSNILHIKLLGSFFKIPLSLKSAKSVHQEIKNYSIIKKKSCYNDYLLPHRSYLLILATKNINDLEKLNSKIFLKKYYKNFVKNELMNYDIIENLIDLKETNFFINQHIHEILNIFFDYIKSNKINTLPGHGDLYHKNIIATNNKFYIIDWPLYNENYPLNFDIINYKIFSSKYYTNNWYQFLKKNKKKFLKFIDHKHLKSFVLMKVNNELKFTKLDNLKIQKYKFILKDLFLNF